MNLPKLYEEKMKSLLKEDYDKYLESFNDSRYYGLRANTLKVQPQELEKMVDFDLKPVSWCKEGFYYGEQYRPSKHPFYNAGLYYIQEPSAMSTGSMLPVEPGDRVLDLCAAPGGKSTQVAAKLKGKGVIVSNDISASRCKALLKNIEVCGVSNCIITNETPQHLAERFTGFFNKIIVDAPCSGEGMFRKDENAVKSWEEHKTEFCCGLQREILHYAAQMLANGGIIAYSTCTFAPEENEGMINEFLDKHPEFNILEVDKTVGFDYGKPQWCNAREELKKAGRLWPYKIKGEGHFLCLLQKQGVPVDVELPREKEVSEKLLADYYDFMNKYLNIEIKDNIIQHKDSLICVPMGISLKGLRVMRSGLYLGDLKTKRFEPSQAFAMTLRKEDAKLTVDFDIESEGLQRYMRGESFNVDCADGWALVCCQGYPLGWGKVQKGRLKNKYLSSWMC